jgi:hypothetical protein
MPAMLTFKKITGFMIYNFFDTKSACTVLAVRHHAWLACEIEDLIADATF